MVDAPFGPMGVNRMPLADRIRTNKVSEAIFAQHPLDEDPHDVPADAPEDAHAQPHSANRPVKTLIYGVATLGLIGGIFVWAYQTASRDVLAVPVIEALEGSHRIMPRDPGGQIVAHQGLTVNELVEGGVVHEPIEQVELAPGALPLLAEDIPATTNPATAADVAPADVTPADTPMTDTVAATETAPASGEGMALAPEAQGTLEVAEAPAETAPTDAAPQASVAAETPPTEVVKAAPARALPPSIRPIMRPRAVAETASATVSATTPPASTTPTEQRQFIAPGVVESLLSSMISEQSPPSATVPAPLSAQVSASGTAQPIVQLGLFSSDAAARTEWSRLTQRIGEPLASKLPLIEKASSGGEPFYRLRASGFASAREAQDFCAVLTQAFETCLPISSR